MGPDRRRRRLGTLALALGMFSSPLQVGTAFVAPASRRSAECSDRPSTCCCTPCPGPPACSCDHGASAVGAVCLIRAEESPLAAPSPPAPAPSRLACEPPERPAPATFEFRPLVADVVPRFAPFAEPLEKVPIFAA